MRVFVTGGTGFIGANLVRLLLKDGYQVKALVRPNSRIDNLKGLDNLEIVLGDIQDDNLSGLMQGCEALFHVAAHYSLWQSDKDLLYRNNVLGTRRVLEAAAAAKVERVVYTSSVAAIGVDNTGLPVDETHQTPVEDLVGFYKQSKYWAEQEALKAVKNGLDVVIVNPSTPVGAFDIKPTPTGDIILRFLRRMMPAYVDTGLNLVDVLDVARGHILALNKGKSGDRYILGHQNLTFQQLLAMLEEITHLKAPQTKLPLWLPLTVAWIDEFVLTRFGKSPSVPVDGVKMSKYFMYYNTTKAVKELGLPQSPIKGALIDAVNWFVEQGYVKN